MATQEGELTDRFGGETGNVGEHTRCLRACRPWRVKGLTPNLQPQSLHALRVTCVAETPPPGAAAMLSEDLYGNLSYEDDFSTPRWKHFGDLEVAHPDHGGYRDGGFWVGMVGGSATSTTITQRISSPRPLQNLVVTLDCYADAKNLGGYVLLQVATPRRSTEMGNRHGRSSPGSVASGSARVMNSATRRNSMYALYCEAPAASNTGRRRAPGLMRCISMRNRIRCELFLSVGGTDLPRSPRRNQVQDRQHEECQ